MQHDHICMTSHGQQMFFFFLFPFSISAMFCCIAFIEKQHTDKLKETDDLKWREKEHPVWHVLNHELYFTGHNQVVSVTLVVFNLR